MSYLNVPRITSYRLFILPLLLHFMIFTIHTVYTRYQLRCDSFFLLPTNYYWECLEVFGVAASCRFCWALFSGCLPDGPQAKGLWRGEYHLLTKHDGKWSWQVNIKTKHKKALTSRKDIINSKENNHLEEQEGDREMTWCQTQKWG